MAGNGWKMLMECLSVGRAISLPCSANGVILQELLECIIILTTGINLRYQFIRWKE